MLRNEGKNKFENLSKAGKTAAKLNIISARVFLNNRQKKNRKKDCLAISALESIENRKKIDKNEDDENYVDIFSVNKKCKSQSPNSKNNSFLQKRKKSKKYVYHDKHMQNLEKMKRKVIPNPSCTKYNPKYDSILKGAKSLPLWEKTTGRIYPKKETFEHNFYLQHDNIEDTMAGKTFIDMSKQMSKRSFDNNDTINDQTYKITNRYSNSKNRPLSSRISEYYNEIKKNTKISSDSFIQNNSGHNKKEKRNILSKPLRSNSLLIKKGNKTFNETKKKYYYYYSKKSTNNNNTKRNTIYRNMNNNLSNYYNHNNNIQNNEDIQENIDSNNSSKDSYDSFRQIYMKRKKLRNNINQYYINRSYGNSKENSFLKSNKEMKKKIKAPDFEKCISRESLDKIEENKIPVTPYLLPNYKYVRGKPIMMVVYDRKKHKINRSKSASLMRVDNSFYYDQNKVIENINNHISIHPPNFNLMASRPFDKDPLPSYMKKIFSKSSCYEMSEKSLKLNNYKNGEYIAFKSSMWPKMSFNKIININMLKSKNFINNINFDGHSGDINNNIYGTSLKFYINNYKDILKESILPKFDGITFKSIDDKMNINIKEIINIEEKINN